MTPPPPSGRYQFLDHTADLRLRLAAPTPTDIYRLAIAALGEAVATEDVTLAEATPATTTVALEGVDPADLLVCLLNEGLFLIERDSTVPTDLLITTVSDTRLEGQLLCRPCAEPDTLLDIKAATYSDLVWETADAGLVAELTFDL